MTRAGSSRVCLARPTIQDCEEFLKCVRHSRSFHRPWVYPPSTAAGFARFLEGLNAARNEGFLVKLRETEEIAGVFVVSEIMRGVMQSAYLGFYAVSPHGGLGYMGDGLRLLLRYVFRELRLHRLEASIQPENLRSLKLVRRYGFRHEGFSPRYLKIGGKWRDHERWAILAEDWRASRG